MGTRKVREAGPRGGRSIDRLLSLATMSAFVVEDLVLVVSVLSDVNQTTCAEEGEMLEETRIV